MKLEFATGPRVGKGLHVHIYHVKCHFATKLVTI